MKFEESLEFLTKEASQSINRLLAAQELKKKCLKVMIIFLSLDQRTFNHLNLAQIQFVSICSNHQFVSSETQHP